MEGGKIKHRTTALTHTNAELASSTRDSIGNGGEGGKEGREDVRKWRMESFKHNTIADIFCLV